MIIFAKSYSIHRNTIIFKTIALTRSPDLKTKKALQKIATEGQILRRIDCVNELDDVGVRQSLHNPYFAPHGLPSLRLGKLLLFIYLSGNLVTSLDEPGFRQNIVIKWKISDSSSPLDR